MFRLASLVAVAAASASSTADKDEAKAKAQVAKAQKDIKSTVLSSTKVAGLEVPFHDGKAVTYADLALPGDDYRYQCLFAEGASWVAATKSGKTDVAAHCEISKDKLTALNKDAKKLDQDVTLNTDLTYEEFFAGLETAVGTSYSYKTYGHTRVVMDGGAPANNNGVPNQCHASCSTDDFETTPGYHFDYSWVKNDASTAGTWCYTKTVLPKTFSGGLLLTHTAAADTQVRVKVDSTVNRYFDNASLVSMALGKSKQIPLTGADSIEVYYAQNQKWAAADKGEDFKLTFKRASYMDIAKLTAENGGAITWIIIGCVVLLACLAVCILWKLGKCCFGGKKDEEDMFYYSDDLYARV